MNFIIKSGWKVLCHFLIVFSLPNFSLSQSYRWVPYVPPNITPFYDISDTNSLTVIDKINNYNILQNVLSYIHEIEDDANNRIHFELHLSGGLSYDIDNDTAGWVGALSFKINLCNPKIPNASDILVKINRLHNLIDLTGFRLPEATSNRIDNIESQLKNYDRQFWWKRLSIGATIPFIETQYYDYIHLNFKDIYIFGGYDLGDVITLLIGMNKDKKVLFAASVDLSTPLYSLAEDFKNMVSRLLRIPGRRDYYYEW